MLNLKICVEDEKLLLTDNDWFLSSINIANKILKETKKLAAKTHQKIIPPGLDLFYVRGDRNVMENIELLWKTTNENVKRANKVDGKNAHTYNNINKWSPADIYFASAKAKKIFNELANDSETKKGNLTFAELNETKVSIDGVEKGLGEMMEADESIRAFDLDLMNDNDYDENDSNQNNRFKGIMDSAFDVNMGGNIVTGKVLKDCIGVKNTTEMKQKFVLQEAQGKDKKGRDARFTYDANDNGIPLS